MMASPTPNSDEIKRRVAGFYDAHAEHYLDWTAAHDEHQLKLHYLDKALNHLHKKAQAQADKQMKVLELGCGAGVPTAQILAAEPGVHLTAVDISAAQLALARKRIPNDNVKFVESDMMALEFEDGSLDAVIAFYSIIHLPRDEQLVLISRIGKWLKPGGVCLIMLSVDAFEEKVAENVSCLVC
jgi:ubiquinone/menaquinone biosynthesis C-methylase UbiE